LCVSSSSSSSSSSVFFSFKVWGVARTDPSSSWRHSPL
jgi:hypothetical protein